MRTAAQAEWVLDETSEAEAVVSHLSDLLQRLQCQEAEQDRIAQHQGFLSLPRMVTEDLALTKQEVCCSGGPCLSDSVTVPLWFASSRNTRSASLYAVAVLGDALVCCLLFCLMHLLQVKIGPMKRL